MCGPLGSKIYLNKEINMKRKTISIVLAAVMVLTMCLATTLPVGAATEEEIEDSIEAGIAWLASVQNGDGSWGSTEYIGPTGLILVKLEDRAFELGFDGPFDDGYPLKTNVVAGLDFLLQYADTVAISPQIAGEPDSNGNGLGISLYGQTYYTSILMMAIAAGRDPSRVVATGPLTGWTYGDVLQDIADWTAYAQTDTGDGRGGWSYSAVSGGGSADQSNAGYAMLGLLYAQAPLYGYESDIPGFVATELNYWIDWAQDDVDGDDYDGGSAYSTGWGLGFWVNSLKTGNLLTEMAFVGDGLSDTRVQDALEYIGRHWEDDWIQGWGKSHPVQYQATYCLMKGFEAMGVPLDGVPGVADWYQDMADAILAEQDIAGYWPSNPAYVWPDGSLGYVVDPELATAWALLTLERIAPPPPVIVVTVDVKPMSWPNPLNVNSKGVLPVAILGTEDFDVTQIDPATMLLEGIAQLHWALEDVGTVGDQLAGPDGFMDFTLKSDAQEIAAALGDVSDGDVIVLHLTGNLKEEFGGTPIAGEDVVRIIEKK
jgi:hypothetical protein